MALKKTSETHFGFLAIDSYHRVEGVSLPDKVRVDFVVRSYKSDEPNIIPFLENFFSCPYIIEQENPITQAYKHLKTLPEFAGATDC